MKVILKLLFISLILIGSSMVQGARILAVIPLPTRSHHRFTQPLLKALARAGHEVVVYSPYPLDEPQTNYTDIVIENIPVTNMSFSTMILEFMNRPYYKCLELYYETMDLAFNNFIMNEKIHQLIASKEHFDLVVTEVFTGQEFTLYLGHIFKAPVIGLQPFVTNSAVNMNLGNTLALPYIPDTCSPFGNRMSFLERLLNSVIILRGLSYVYYYQYLPSAEVRMKQYFPDTPPFLDMINNVALMFINDHQTADYSRPRTPNIVPVGGIHIEDVKPLPKDIQTFMDESSDGVILFSLGTCVPDELQPQEYFDMYNNVFRQLRQRVLWKTRKENIQGLPDNVVTVKWLPQRDVLAHPNCVLFITHGGLLSQHEAIHCGVPVVTIPQFFDQYRNARLYQERGIGVQLNLQDISETTVLAAIHTVLDNPQYTSNMKRLSSVYRDRPMTPAETVVYWTEYVLRHGGAHLRPASTQLSWYQLALLDVLALILAVLVSLAVAVFIICRKILMFINSKRTSIQIKEKYN